MNRLPINSLHEQQNRRYLIGLLGICLLLLALTAINGYLQLQQARQLLLAQQQATASVLLARQIDPSVIAQALTGQSSSAAGCAFLQQLGLTEQLPLRLFPYLRESLPSFFLLPALLTGLCCLLLLGGTLRFLNRRELLYQEAAAVLTAFAAGDFSRHLPRGQTGALYQLLAAADQLAMALASKIELERRQKLFLQDTISDISHQLKTPLAALSMYTEIMAAEPHNAAAVKSFTEKSAQSIQRMERLIQTLLKLMRLDAGMLLFEKKRHTVLDVVSQAAAQHWTRAQREQKQLLLTGSDTETIFCDLDWTSEALSNLIKNALDHTASGGTVQIGWQRSPAMLRITVQDNGAGIAPKDLHHIFKRFYRARHTAGQQGSGLGLPLAKSIAEGQGGLLSVQSAPGQGSVFTLSFLTES